MPRVSQNTAAAEPIKPVAAIRNSVLVRLSNGLRAAASDSAVPATSMKALPDRGILTGARSLRPDAPAGAALLRDTVSPDFTDKVTISPVRSANSWALSSMPIVIQATGSGRLTGAATS